MAAQFCPHCQVMSTRRRSFEIDGTWGTYKHVEAVFQSCDNCRGLIITILDKSNSQRKPINVFPAAMPTVDDCIPQMVAEDYISGVNCLGINEYKAAATMFRRSLQQIMLDKHAEGKYLYNQIDDLATRAIITTDMKDWAHEVRLWGNEGAHPEQIISSISPQAVEESKAFLERMFEYIYILPSRLQASRQLRKKEE